MEYGYFFTGFPGFISNQLIREVLRRNEGKGTVYVLVLPAMAEKAEAERAAIVKDFNLDESRFEILTGDITVSGLDISPVKADQLEKNVTHVFHLAAIYDLAVPKDIAYRVNVEGTRNVNEWAKRLKNIQRYTYFSTAYVAGKREGILYEDELIKPPGFKNFYEETKYEAEVLVDSLKSEIPVTIIRPGIVKGHSKTGETIKFDGPYFIMNFIDRLGFMPFLPKLGTGETVVNLVPVDYIIEATTYLTFAEIGSGKTYHLTDPKPYKVSELYEMMMFELLKKQPVGSVPLSLAKAGLQFRGLRRYLGVEKEALDYFTWKGRFDSSQAQDDLKDSGIVCPDFRDGIASMAAFYRENKHKPHYQINII
ncbi:SDR family oxidoreductase [Bacillus sp. ISL-35]|uniref:SDR family oxidoreductase n=1 Tax=Bacillus sp. ISL-35 TaxID=2819122 RepID=UPI001BE7A128|nr:SDR family oxidoreductase [Bacillus sp. ISL-35]MBT2678320.1 SDR family oxidoreductase [Bacillus sp. ISL-35]MBT2705956.1 SDR family oxidoreductase [Chryseobacterium sp. ISL-80]